MLPVITNTADAPDRTSDDAANLPPQQIEPCVGFDVDVRGPGFTTGDVTWSVLNSASAAVTGAVIAGQNTIQATIAFPPNTPPGVYTIKACLTSAPTDCSTQTITVVALPAITVGTPNQPYIGGQTKFNTTLPYPVTWAPAELNATGLATWTTAGIKAVTYTLGGCTVTTSYRVYADISVAQYVPGGNCIYINSGQSLALTVTGGSGSYAYSVTGQNSVTTAGIIQAGFYAGEYTLTIIDKEIGIIKNIPICIGSQTQFCVAVADTVCLEENIESPCCEVTVDCGETIALKVPTFHLRVNGTEQEIRYNNSGSGTSGEGGYLKSGMGITNARANDINCENKENLFEIVTSLDMADVPNAPFGIGFSQLESGSGVNTIDIAAVWFTSASVRYVELRKEGVPVLGSRFPISHGDIVSAGYKNDSFVIYINNLLKKELINTACCGNQFLDVAIEQANKSLGGHLSGLTWNIITVGSPSEVGSINASGIYATPANARFSLVQAEASVGNATFRVNIRNVKPTPKIIHPNAFLAGKAVTIWAGPYIPNFNETIRLAKDGSPDALQNSYKGTDMIDLGTLEGSANFQFSRDFQDFTNDLGEVYYTAISSETATLAATFLQVRDLLKMNILVPSSNLSSKKNGVTEFSVGGLGCDIKQLRVIMVIGRPECDDQYDVLYLPRVQNKGNLGLEVGRQSNGKFEMTLTALPDYTRPSGKQLFSLYQIDSCSGSSCTIS